MSLTNLISILILLFSISSVNAQVASNSNDLSEASFNTATEMVEMYYIYVKESKNHKELFPKLYPIGFIIKEKAKNGKKTKYMFSLNSPMTSSQLRGLLPFQALLLFLTFNYCVENTAFLIAPSTKLSLPT